MARGPGLGLSQFCNSIADSDLRRFFDPGVLTVLNAIFGGQIGGKDLRRVTQTLIDLDAMLSEEVGRRLILELLPEQKRTKFEVRVGRGANPNSASEWTQAEINRACDFFGLFEERIQPPVTPASATIFPLYSLFDHQRDAVRRLRPLLFADERRALLHLPTGAGKTRTAMHIVSNILQNHEPSVVVWLASGKELLEQAVLALTKNFSITPSRWLSIKR